MNKQPDEDMCLQRVNKVRRVLKEGTFVSIGFGVCYLLSCQCVYHPRGSLNSMFLGFLWRLHLIEVINHKLNLSPLPRE